MRMSIFLILFVSSFFLSACNVDTYLSRREHLVVEYMPSKSTTISTSTNIDVKIYDISSWTASELAKLETCLIDYQNDIGSDVARRLHIVFTHEFYVTHSEVMLYSEFPKARLLKGVYWGLYKRFIDGEVHWYACIALRDEDYISHLRPPAGDIAFRFKSVIYHELGHCLADLLGYDVMCRHRAFKKQVEKTTRGLLLRYNFAPESVTAYSSKWRNAKPEECFCDAYAYARMRDSHFSHRPYVTQNIFLIEKLIFEWKKLQQYSE